MVVTCLGGQDGPFPLVRVTTNRGPVISTRIGTEGMYTGYWLYEGEVTASLSFAEVYTRGSAYSDKLGEHLGRLTSDD